MGSGDLRELFDMPARLYAVGDVHGCSSELRVLIERLKGSEGLNSQDLVVFIGDYIDRGTAVRETLDQLVEFKHEFPRTIFLKGNHESMLLGYLELGGRDGEVYIQNGGQSTLDSYGITAGMHSEQAVDLIPKEHVEFLQSLERYVIIQNFVFAHAGLNPLRDLRAQLDEDLYWIRDEFIHNLHHFGKTIIFGHTPYEDVLVHLPYKIGIDTGVVYGNCLSCVELIGQRVIQVAAGTGKVVEKGLEG